MSNQPERSYSHQMIMRLDKKLKDGQEQIVRVMYNKFNWHLRVTRYTARLAGDDERYVASLHCDPIERSSEMWRVYASIRMTINQPHLGQHVFIPISHSFTSWNQGCGSFDLTHLQPIHPSTTDVTITIDSTVESFALRPILDLRSSLHDVILVLGDQKLPVNKQVLSAQSSYFNDLFYIKFKQARMEEIEIKDTDPEEFHELLLMMYGISTEPTTVENAIQYLTMADKFDLQIVRQRIENFLLSTNLISIHRKLLIAEENKLQILKSEVRDLYYIKENLVGLRNSDEYRHFPYSLVKDLMFGIACDLLEE